MVRDTKKSRSFSQKFTRWRKSCNLKASEPHIFRSSTFITRSFVTTNGCILNLEVTLIKLKKLLLIWTSNRGEPRTNHIVALTTVLSLCLNFDNKSRQDYLKTTAIDDPTSDKMTWRSISNWPAAVAVTVFRSLYNSHVKNISEICLVWLSDLSLTNWWTMEKGA